MSYEEETFEGTTCR